VQISGLLVPYFLLFKGPSLPSFASVENSSVWIAYFQIPGTVQEPYNPSDNRQALFVYPLLVSGGSGLSGSGWR
jgi:hypothetical protein